jgi:hypothetical protein
LLPRSPNINPGRGIVPDNGRRTTMIKKRVIWAVAVVAIARV